MKFKLKAVSNKSQYHNCIIEDPTLNEYRFIYANDDMYEVYVEEDDGMRLVIKIPHSQVNASIKDGHWKVKRKINDNGKTEGET